MPGSSQPIQSLSGISYETILGKMIAMENFSGG